MKKLVFTTLLFVLIGIGTSNAQKYFTYDGKVFNILITCDDDNKNVTAIEFTNKDKSAWVHFTIVGSTNLDNTKEGGFIFYCKDGKGDYYAIDYYRDGDYVIVHACNADKEYTGTNWTLNRRKE